MYDSFLFLCIVMTSVCFFKQKTAYELRISDWSSDVCSSDLAFAVLFFVSVGMLFNPAILVERPWSVLVTVLIIIVGKSVAAYGIVRAFGNPQKTAFNVAASLAQIGEY